jgi:hypothetical protein
MEPSRGAVVVVLPIETKIISIPTIFGLGYLVRVSSALMI